MQLDPFSPTLISDWAEQAFGVTLTPNRKSNLDEWLSRQEANLNAERLLPLKTDVEDVFVLARKTERNRNGRRDKRVLALYVSYRGQSFVRLNDIFLADERGNLDAIVNRKVAHFQSNKADNRTNRVDLPWRFIRNFGAAGQAPKIAGMPKAMATAAFHKSKWAIKAGRHYLSPEAKVAAESTIALLANALRQRLREPETKTIRDIIDLLGSETLTTMRHLHNFDNRFYEWLVAPQDIELRKRRRQFADAFPMVIYYIYNALPRSKVKQLLDLTDAIDRGLPLLSGEGLEKITEVFSLYQNKYNKQIMTRTLSTQAARALATLRPLRLGKTKNQIIELVPLLDKIPPRHWPKTDKGYKLIITFPRNIPAQVFFDLGGAPGGWDNLYDFIAKAIARRYRAIADTETYRQAQQAIAAGGPTPKPVEPAPISGEDITGAPARVADYINMVIDRVIIPAKYAKGIELTAEDKKNYMMVFLFLLLSSN